MRFTVRYHQTQDVTHLQSSLEASAAQNMADTWRRVPGYIAVYLPMNGALRGRLYTVSPAVVLNSEHRECGVSCGFFSFFCLSAAEV